MTTEDKLKEETMLSKVFQFQEGIKQGIREEKERLAKSHFQKDNHRIGCELESYTGVLFYRGLKKEHDMLLEVASRLK